MNSEITKYILSLMKTKGVGPAFIKKRLHIFKNYQDNITVFKENFYLSLSKKEEERIDIERHLDEAEKILDECLQYNILVIEITNDLYPKNLLELKDPPPVLFCKGNISLLEKQIIGIIGTRKATKLGEKIANRVGSFFSLHFSITNGLVDGIDKCSILNNNEAYSNVIGILSGGLNFNFTSSLITQNLATKVLNNNGLLISELSPNEKEDAFSGSKSSRIQAGLSNVLILIQSSIDGGSKYTLNSFKDLKRLLAVINFSDNEDFNSSESFSANRLMTLTPYKGLSLICEKIKNKNMVFNENIDTNKVKLNRIITLENKNDYYKIIDYLKELNSSSENTLFNIYKEK
ncbi:MAG: DNA-processing protein DprA [Campylobacterota bacterium]|nr:DNA-processing protein DprA [Campylobacterota bacterium]